MHSYRSMFMLVLALGLILSACGAPATPSLRLNLPR